MQLCLARFFIAAVLLLISTHAFSQTISNWRFKAGNDFAWSATKLNDSQWSPIQVPGDWVQQGLGEPFGEGWYRADLHVAKPPQQDVYIYLGSVHSVDKLFINGTVIGQYGQFFPEYINANKAIRLYQVPAQLFHQGNNTLALRVQSSFPVGGLVYAMPAFGSYSELVNKQMNKLLRIRIYEGISISFFLFTCIFVLFIILSQRGQMRFTNLFWYIFILFILSLIGSNWFYQLGWKTEYVQRIYYVLCSISTVVLLKFIIRFFAFTYTILDKIFIAILLGFAAWMLSPLWSGFNHTLIILNWATPMAMMGWIAIRSIWVIHKNAIKLNASVYCGAIAIVSPAIGSYLEGEAIRVNEDIGALVASQMISTAFLLVLACKKYITLLHTVAALNQQVQLIQDMERSRIARDLHDRIGQRLVALKLQIQMLLHKQTRVAIQQQLVNDVDGCIRNIRQVIHGIKPIELSKGVAASISAKAIQISKQTDVQISTTIDPTIDKLSINQAENLFLICTEALNNAIKHAQSTHITINIQRRGDTFSMQIVDNGKGFVQQSNLKGMGLISMRERALTLNSTLQIESQLGTGTSISLSPSP